MDSTPDKFDRLMGLLDGLPDTLRTRATTITITHPLGVGGSESYIVQTVRQQHRDADGKVTRSEDTVFLIAVDREGRYRIALPPAVADAIVRQRESLTGRSRARAGKARSAAKAALRAVGGGK